MQAVQCSLSSRNRTHSIRWESLSSSRSFSEPSADWRCLTTWVVQISNSAARSIAQRDGQVGHLVEAGGTFLEEPLSHLSRPIGRQAAFDKPITEPGGSLFENGDHNAVRAVRACYMVKIPATGELKPGNNSPPVNTSAEVSMIALRSAP